MGFLTAGNDGFNTTSHIYQNERIINKIDHQAEIRKFNKMQREKQMKGIILAIFLLTFNSIVFGLIFLLVK